MISAYIFSGPTLPPYLIEEALGLEINAHNEIILNNNKIIKILPPVSEGDVFKIIKDRPLAIGIVDGYFETMPSVWHKEILLAMTHGIHVLGSSSMGALRAAELHTFGMEGVGAIYQAYVDGWLEDDDEVTVVHGPAEIGYPLLSEAMVNVRRTLDDAHAANVITSEQKALMLNAAKRLHYKKRTYGNVITEVKNHSCHTEYLVKFEKWLENGRQDQKLLDGILLIKNIIDKLQNDIAEKKVIYNFENTIIWMRSRTNHQEPSRAPNQ